MHFTHAMYDDVGDERYKKWEAKNFVVKLNHDMHEFEEKIKHLESSVEQREMEETLLILQRQKEAEDRAIQEKRKKIEEQIQRNEEYRKHRVEDMKEWKSRLQDLKQHRTHLQKLEEQGKKN